MSNPVEASKYRTPIGNKHIEGAMIWEPSSPVNRGDLDGEIKDEYALDIDEIVLQSFSILQDERERLNLHPAYNGTHYRIVGEPHGTSCIRVPLSAMSYAHHALPRDPAVRHPVRSHIEKMLAAFDCAESGSSLHPCNTTPLGVIAFMSTSDRKILLSRRSRHTQTAPGRWDVSFGGYVNRRDVGNDENGDGYIDFWRTARREAQDELLGYTIEERSLKFFGLHRSAEAVDLIGHYASQSTAKEIDLYLKSGKKHREPESEGVVFDWMAADPDGLAAFCRRESIVFGGPCDEPSGRSVLLPEAATCLRLTLMDLGFDLDEIDRSVEMFCR